MTSRDLDYGLECQDENGGCMCCSLLKCEDRDHESCGEITPKLEEKPNANSDPDGDSGNNRNHPSRTL